MALQFGSNTGGRDFFAALNARRKFEEAVQQQTPEQKQAVQQYWNQMPSSAQTGWSNSSLDFGDILKSGFKSTILNLPGTVVSAVPALQKGVETLSPSYWLQRGIAKATGLEKAPVYQQNQERQQQFNKTLLETGKDLNQRVESIGALKSTQPGGLGETVGSLGGNVAQDIAVSTGLTAAGAPAAIPAYFGTKYGGQTAADIYKQTGDVNKATAGGGASAVINAATGAFSANQLLKPSTNALFNFVARPAVGAGEAATQQIVSNVATKYTSNPNQNIFENVPMAAGFGAFGGASLGLTNQLSRPKSTLLNELSTTTNENQISKTLSNNGLDFVDNATIKQIANTTDKKAITTALYGAADRADAAVAQPRITPTVSTSAATQPTPAPTLRPTAQPVAQAITQPVPLKSNIDISSPESISLKPVEVPINKLQSIKGDRQLAMQDFNAGRYSMTDLPVLVKKEKSGALTVLDGNGRIIAAQQAGQTNIPVTTNEKLYRDILTKRETLTPPEVKMVKPTVAAKAPKGQEAYHSTAALEIQGGKLRASSDGVMGEGVYLHTNPETARLYGAMQGDGNIGDQKALKVKIKTDNIYQLPDNNYPTPEQVAVIKRNGHDGIRLKGGEMVIFDSKNVELTDIYNQANKPTVAAKTAQITPEVKLSSSGNVYIKIGKNEIVNIPKTVQKDIYDAANGVIPIPERRLKANTILNKSGLEMTADGKITSYNKEITKLKAKVATAETPLVESPAKPTVANVNKIAGPEDFQKEAVRISQEQNIPVKQAAKEIDARLKMVNEATVKGKGQPTVPGEPIEIQGKVLKDPAVKEVLQGVSRGRSAAGVEGSLVAGKIQTEARRLGVDTGPDFVNRYEAGQLRTPQELELASIIKQETDKIFAGQQLLDPTIQYRQNYVPHTFAESQDVVADRVRTLQQQTGAANERVFSTYTDANDILGLNPKFKTIDQMVGDMAGRTAAALENRATIRRGLESGLFSTNQKGGRIDVRGMFDENGSQIYAQKGVADVLNNVTQTGTTGLEKVARAVAKVSEIAQDVLLQGGIPGTNANFFVAGQAVKDTTRNIGRFLLNPVQAVKQEGNLIGSFFRTKNQNRQRATTGTFKANGQTIKNADFIRDLAKEGLPISFETSLTGQGQNVYKRFWDKLGNNPTFQGYMPNRMLDTAQEVYAQSVKKLGHQEALKLAADTTKAFLGHVDTVASGRSNLTKDLTSAVLFAPKYRESIVTALGNMVKSVTTETGNKAFAPSRQLLLGMGMTLMAYELLNRQLNGHSMLDNRQGQELSLQVPYGEKDEKGRQPVANVPFMPGFMTLPRAGFGFAKGVLTGDFKSATAEASKAFSAPIQTAGAIIGNRDYFGRPIYMDQDTAALEGVAPGSAAQNALDIGAYVVGQGTPAWGRGIMDLMKGKPTEQAIATALEAPVRFGKELPPAQKGYFKDREEVYNTLDVNDRAVWDAIYPKIKNSRGEYIAEKSIDYGMTRAANFLNSPAVLAAANEMARRAKDRGEKIDPFFELDPTQQRIALRMDTLPPKDPNRTVLKKENAWYQDFSKSRSAFFDSLPAGDPNKPKGPIDYPEASDQVKQLQDAYYQIKDPKMKRDFMTKNPELGEQFAKEEQYTRAVRALKNLPQYDQYPEPSTEVQALMDAYSALPKGEANGKSRIRSAWIKSHPEEWSKMTDQFNKIAQFNLEQDAQIAAFEGQDLTDKGIKAIASLAGGGGNKTFGAGKPKTISSVQGAGLRKAVTFKTPKLGRVATKGISVKPAKIAKPKVSIKRNVL